MLANYQTSVIYAIEFYKLFFKNRFIRFFLLKLTFINSVSSQHIHDLKQSFIHYIYNIGDVMVSTLSSSDIRSWVRTLLGQTKDLQNWYVLLLHYARSTNE